VNYLNLEACEDRLGNTEILVELYYYALRYYEFYITLAFSKWRLVAMKKRTGGQNNLVMRYEICSSSLSTRVELGSPNLDQVPSLLQSLSWPSKKLRFSE